MRYGWPEVRAALEDNGYAVFEGEYDLNLVGIRSLERKAGRFDDELHCAYLHDGAWVHHAWPCTTDPGSYYLKNPMNEKGTAILVTGQHRGAFRPGLHQGKYPALVQARPLPVWRDKDYDDELDMGGYVDVGWHGIHVHRASASGPSTEVGRWSAGCQVLADARHLEELLGLVSKQAAHGLGETVTYTLLTEADL